MVEEEVEDEIVVENNVEEDLVEKGKLEKEEVENKNILIKRKGKEKVNTIPVQNLAYPYAPSNKDNARHCA